MGRRTGLVVAIALAGCTDATPASQISAWAEVTITESTISLQAELRDFSRGNGWVSAYTLEPGERLFGTFRGQEFVVSPNAFSRFPYTGGMEYSGDVRDDEEIALVLEREDESIRVVGTTPLPLEIVTPTSTPISEDIEIRWTPISPDAMRWRTGPYCPGESEGPVPVDTGTLVFPAGLIFGVSICDELILTRERVTLPSTPLQFARMQVGLDYLVTIVVTP